MTNEPLPLWVAVAAEVRALMARRGVSQLALAAGTGMQQSYISRRLGRRPEFALDIRELDEIARFLGTSAREVLLAAETEVARSRGNVSDLRDRMRPSDTGLANAAYSSDDGVPPEQTDHDFDI